jgi:two-component system, OmpR family, response regulator RegX3
MPSTVRTGRPGASGLEANVRQSRCKYAALTDAPHASPCDHGSVHVLVVEDEDAIAVPLVEGLTREGFTVTRVATGQAALDVPGPDVVLLDLRLPDLDGYEVCRRIRARSDVPIIVVTAKGEEVDRVVGLELGADDYVVKPFGLRELVARIRAVSRRAGRQSVDSELLQADGLTLDLRARRASMDGCEVQLTLKEFDLLALLMRDAGAVVTKQRILNEVWNTSWYGATKTVDVHVASLRKKLGDPGLIETVRGVGLRFRNGR